ncbi:zinc metalloproteinase nas-4-like [Rhopilema esculentum]|uniref:zinc metalloproteinase nas-4-like n=1 Tax=Rhopilema esculentum TaxID=499914 RepID=UPI0031D67A31
MRQFKEKTCLRFVPKTRRDKDYIKFIVDEGCYSTGVGKNAEGGVQYVSIGDGCNYIGTVIHEMMHAIGFFHEHTRLDRDQFVTINWQNIERGRESQFQKYAHGEGDYLGEPYDYDSVMHYPRYGFGIKLNGKTLPTIVPKDKPWRKIGQRQMFSDIDLRQINKLYQCRKFTSKY